MKTAKLKILTIAAIGFAFGAGSVLRAGGLRSEEFKQGDQPGEECSANDQWRYFWAKSNGDKWFEGAQAMIWDEEWFGSGAGCWARGDNKPPSVSSKTVSINFLPEYRDLGVVVGWKNSESKPVKVKVEGSLKPTWSYLKSQNAAPDQWPDVDVVILIAEGSGKTGVPVFKKTFRYKTDQNVKTAVEETVTVPEGGSIIFAYSADDKTDANGWVTIEDALSVDAE